MGRIVGECGGDLLGIRRRSGRAARSAALLLFASGWASAGDPDNPDLAPPTDPPKAARPDVPTPAASAPGGPVLAVPGLTIPGARPLVSTSAAPAGLAAPSLSADVPLDAPLEMRGAPSIARPRAGFPSDRPAPPIVLESSSPEDSLPIGEPLRRPGEPRSRSTSGGLRAEEHPGAPSIAPAPRRNRFLGLFPAPAPPAPRTNPRARSTDEDVRDDPSSGPALKDRIERQARQAVGDHARSIEVRLVGRNVAIQARGVKFYQKRGVRKALEALPALSGLRSTIEIAD